MNSQKCIISITQAENGNHPRIANKLGRELSEKWLGRLHLLILSAGGLHTNKSLFISVEPFFIQIWAYLCIYIYIYIFTLF